MSRKETKSMGVNESRAFINDVVSKKLKRKKVCKKKNYRNLLEALDILNKELENSQKLNEMYRNQNDNLMRRNENLSDELNEYGVMIRKYQRMVNPDAYPEETREEIEVLEDLGENYLSASDTLNMFKEPNPVEESSNE